MTGRQARGFVRFRPQGSGRRRYMTCFVGVRSSDGTVIWEDNSSPAIWQRLLKSTRERVFAARLMEAGGQVLEPWDDIVARAPKL